MDKLLLNILLVEDELTDALLLREALDEVPTMKFETTHVQRLDAGLQSLNVRRFDAVLLDLGLPDSQGLATLGEMQSRHSGVPILVLSGLDDENIAVSAVRDGAQDYLVKGKLNGTMLALTIRYAIERKRTEEKMRRGQVQLNEAQRIAHLGSWDWEITNDIVTWSDEMCRIFGIAPQKFQGTYAAYLELVHLEDRERVNAIIQQSCRTHAPFTYYHRVIHPDGAIRVMDGRGVVVTNHAGQASRIMGTAHDMTELNRVEQSLHEAKTQLHAVLDAVPGAVSWISADLKYLGANQHLAKAQHLLPADFVGQEVGFCQTSPEFEDFVRQFFAGETNVAWREVVVQEQDSWRTNLIVAQKYEQGQAAVFVGVDITEHKQVEKALRQSRDELEMRVTERTLELASANVDLHLAKETADAANQAKSDFLSRMSHELRTPLNAILGFGQLLEMRGLEPKESQSVEHILKAGRHLLQLINEVLDISRIEAGYLSLSPEPICVVDIVNEALDLMSPLAALGHIQLINTVAQEAEWYVLADRQRLKQVLLNILANAVKYNRDAGQVTISSEPHTVATGGYGSRLRLSVSDTGFGLNAAEMAKLFVPFERLGAEQIGIEGTGIGLALSKQLIEAMGGTIGIESSVGVGSVFWVELPLAQSPLKHMKHHEVQHRVAAMASKPPSILLYIEDNLPNLAIIEHALANDTTISLLSAIQGSIGLDLARQHHPDLILLDLHLPDIPGDEVLRQLQVDPVTRDIPVVVISADATPRQIERLLAAGARAYLTKPLDLKQFLQVVTENLNESGN